MEINEFKNVYIRNCMYYYYFDDIDKSEDFDFENILIDEESCKNILIYNI